MNSKKVTLPVDVERRFRQLIRPFPDFPTPGILFQDIMPVLKDMALVQEICSVIADHCKNLKEPVQAIAGLEARGFLFGPLISAQLNIPFITIRKKGKLPGETISTGYQKEYGIDVIEIQKDSVDPGSNILIFDDLLATGGTMAGAIDLIRKAGGRIVGTFCLIELTDLNGRNKLADVPFNYLLNF